MAGDPQSIGTGRTGGRDATTGVIPGKYALSVGLPDMPPPAGWKWTLLSSVAQLESGHTPSRKHPEYWDGNVPWIGIKDASDNHGRTIYDTYQHVTKLGLENSSARLLPSSTVCLSRTASVGFVVVMGCPMATSQDFVNWVCGPNIDPHFLKYILLAEIDALWRFASGTTHQTIYYPEAKAFHVCLPPLAEQKRIVKILGDLDDKIELNRKMNKTIEEMVRALFKSWFVDFDPVRAKLDGRPLAGMDAETAALFPSEFEDSDLGPIPKGWEVMAVEKISTVGIGKTPPRKEHQWFSENPSDMPWISIRDLGNAGVFISHTSEFLTASAVEKFRVKKIPDDTVVLSFKLTMGRVAITDGEMLSNEAIAHFRLNRDHPFSSPYLYCYLKGFGYDQLGSTSSIATAINSDMVRGIKILVPKKEISLIFEKNVRPLFTQMKNIQKQSRNLATLRDTLLPKFLSGELSVKILNIDPVLCFLES